MKAPDGPRKSAPPKYRWRCPNGCGTTTSEFAAEQHKKVCVTHECRYCGRLLSRYNSLKIGGAPACRECVDEAEEFLRE